MAQGQSAAVMLNLMALRFVALLVIYPAFATEEKGLEFLKQKEAEEDVVKLPSGLLYKVLKKGALLEVVTKLVYPELIYCEITARGSL